MYAISVIWIVIKTGYGLNCRKEKKDKCLLDLKSKARKTKPYHSFYKKVFQDVTKESYE